MNNQLILVLISLLVCASCANIVSPTGGERDKQAPKLIQAIPKSESVNIQAGSKILIEFDEFIQPVTDLIVVPPLADIEYTTNKSELSITLPDSIPDATYQFFLQEKIKDVNEGNAISTTTSYVFSTTDSIDQHAIQLCVLDAKTQESIPELDFTITSIQNNIAFPLTTDKKGNVSLNFIQEGKYAVYAYQDLNRNDTIDEEEQVYLMDTLNAKLDSIIPIDTVFYFKKTELKQELIALESGFAIYNIAQNSTVETFENIAVIDSIRFDSIHYYFNDSVPKTVIINQDTLRVPKLKVSNRSRTKALTDEQLKQVNQTFSMNTHPCKLNNFTFTTNYPVKLLQFHDTINNLPFQIEQVNYRTIRYSTTELISETDSITLEEIPVKPLVADSIQQQNFLLKNSKIQKSTLILPTISSIGIEIYTKEESILYEGTLDGSSICLPAQTIQVYIFQDINENGKWDIDIKTGEIEARKRLKPIELAPGWEIELEVPEFL